MRALYICYFGVREPLVQTQVLPYLRELRKDRHEFTLLTFEPGLAANWTTDEIESQRAKLGEEGIDWQCLPYHKRFSAAVTVYDIFRGSLRVRRIIKEKSIDILHGRVHVPTVMGALARRFSRRKPKLLFDIRGFFPEEYTDAGIWPENGIIYRSVKRVEKWLMKESDGFVVLTEKARDILFPAFSDDGTDGFGRPVEVIPCCVDFEKRFAIDRETLRRRFRNKMGIDERFVFVHAGALGGLYLNEQIADFLATARERDRSVFAMFLTQSDPGEIVSLLKARGFGIADLFVGKVEPGEMPGYLCAADAGLSFVKAGYATQSRSPTKIPEYLACGLPVIANRGVGDVDDLIERNRIGALINEFNNHEYSQVLKGIIAMGDVSQRSRETSEREFSLSTVGGERYNRLYKKLIP